MAKKALSRKLDIGLDITSNEIRCVALTRKGKEIALERFAVGEISSSVFAAGRVAEPVELGARIKEILRESGVNPRRVIISLSGKAAITRIIELPKMGAAQTRQAISLQINQYVPFPPGDTVYDYKLLPTREGGNPAMQEVLLVATRATTVESLIATSRAAGLETDGIKITSLASWNLLEASMGTYNQGVGIIDMRDTVTDLAFFLNGNFRLSRPVELGFNTIMAKVAQLLGVTPGEAEEYLKTDPVDMTIPEDEIDPTEDNRMREAMLSVFSSFISELIRSIRYYESQAQRSERVGRLVLFGNIRFFPNLEKYIEDQTGLEVQLFNLGSLLQFRQGVYSLDFLEEMGSKLVVASGLCLEHTKKRRELNLMPPAFYTKAINATIVKFALLLFFILGALGYWGFSERVQEVKVTTANLGELTEEKTRLQPDADLFDRYKSEIQSQMNRYNQIFNLIKSQRVWPVIMDELGNRTNDQVLVISVDFEASSNSLEMEGFSLHRVDYLQFAINIDKSPFFTNTTISERESESGSGAGSGGSGAGGGGPVAGGVSSAQGPRTNSLLSGRLEPMQNYRLPRFEYSGASIEDFFRREFLFERDVIWKFKINTDFQTEIVNQAKVVTNLVQLDEVIEDVLQT